MTTLKREMLGETFEVEAEALSPNAIYYLLDYGMGQSLQDSIAGRAKKVRAEIEAEILAGKYVGDATEKGIDEAVRVDLVAHLQKRFDAIISGTVNVRTAGEPRDPLRAVARDMVLAAIRAKYGKAKVTKEKLDELVTKYLTERRDAVQAEYARRRESVGDVEIDI